MLSKRSFVIALGLMMISLGLKVATTEWEIARDYPWIDHLCTDVLMLDQRLFRPSLDGDIPYVDFTFEYPVGTGLFYWIMSFLIGRGDAEHVVRAHAHFILLFEVLNVGLFYLIAVWKEVRRPYLLTTLFFMAPTGLILNSFRFEAVVTTLVLVGYWLHLQRKPIWATLFWSVGSTMKWYPVFFIFAQEYEAYGSGRKRQLMASAAMLIAVSLVFNLPFVVYSYFTRGNIDMWRAVYLFHVNRPLYWDTLLGVAVLWFGYLPIERYAAGWSLGLIAIASFVKPKLTFEYRCVLMVVAVILCNRVYSTQFNLWFYPFLLFALDREAGTRFSQLLTGFIALDVVNVLVYPFAFTMALAELSNFGPSAAADRGGVWTILFSAAILSRAALLVWLSAYVLSSQSAAGAFSHAPKPSRTRYAAT